MSLNLGFGGKKKRPQNKRNSNARQRRQQNLLEVKVRSAKATQQRNRRLWTALCISVIVAATGFGGYLGGREALRHFVWENAELAVATIDLKGESTLTREEVLARTGIAKGQNIFRIDIGAARKALLHLPQVESAEVTRTLPNKITITVMERHPVAWITPPGVEDPTTSDASFLLDARARLLPGRNYRSEDRYLPVISGLPTAEFVAGQTLDTPEIKGALDLIHLCESAPERSRVRTIDLSKGYCMVVTDRAHAQVQLPFEQLDWQLERLNTLHQYAEKNGRELQKVNLLMTKNVPVTFVPLSEPAVEETAVATPSLDQSSPPSAAKSNKPASDVAPNGIYRPPASVTPTPSPTPRVIYKPSPTPSPSIQKATPARTPFLSPGSKSKPTPRATPRAKPRSSTSRHG